MSQKSWTEPENEVLRKALVKAEEYDVNAIGLAMQMMDDAKFTGRTKQSIQCQLSRVRREQEGAKRALESKAQEGGNGFEPLNGDTGFLFPHESLPTLQEMAGTSRMNENRLVRVETMMEAMCHQLDIDVPPPAEVS